MSKDHDLSGSCHYVRSAVKLLLSHGLKLVFILFLFTNWFISRLSYCVGSEVILADMTAALLMVSVAIDHVVSALVAPGALYQRRCMTKKRQSLFGPM